MTITIYTDGACSGNPRPRWLGGHSRGTQTTFMYAKSQGKKVRIFGGCNVDIQHLRYWTPNSE